MEIDARNVFWAENPVVLFATITAITLVGGAALTISRSAALSVLVLGAVLVGVLYYGIGRWQQLEIGRTFALIERVANAPTVDEARSIGRTVQ